jgi:hypothetical protein
MESSKSFKNSIVLHLQPRVKDFASRARELADSDRGRPVVQYLSFEYHSEVQNWP